MSGISKGLDFLKRQQEAAQRPDTIFKLWVSSGDTARFWMMVEDVDRDMLAPLVHSQKRMSKAQPGKPAKEFTVDLLCNRETRDDPMDQCEYCVEGVDGPWHRLICWTYVEQIVHSTLKVKKDGSPYDWEMMKRGNTKVFMETPDPRLRLFIAKTRLAQQIMNKYEEFGTLFDRPYKLEKTGTGTSTLEVLSAPDDAVKMPDEVLEAFNNRPSLEEAIRSEFTRFAPRKVTSLGGRGIYVPESTDSEPIDFE